MTIIRSKQSFAAGNGIVGDSTRKVVECVGQESGAILSGTELRV